ncbi:uncharacterized protein [Rutidosis leptorrhynchoides]|uniref:uncharacterized protein n=1 Tax=Rutidosis leptorrhynchoides TaxID=125765 RepID=UPI003A99B6C2
MRGFGRDDKTENKVSWFRKIRLRELPDVVAVQESKCNLVNDKWIELIWGSSRFQYIQKPKLGKSGGMFLIWDPSIFVVIEAVEKQHLLAVKGCWKGKDKETVIVNVYGPYKDEEKRKFWESLEGLMELDNVEWVIGGDFNEAIGRWTRPSTDGACPSTNGFNFTDRPIVKSIDRWCGDDRPTVFDDRPIVYAVGILTKC